MNKMRLAIVGCGDIAGFTAWVSRLVPQVTLSVCCDVNEERAKSFAKRHRISQIFTDYSELLNKANVDAVYLAVPHHLHYEMIMSAVGAGKPVFVEKPLTRTLSEGKKLIQAIGNAKVGVNYQYRYDSGCYALARAVQSGALGKVHSIRINIPWHRTQKYFDGASWHKTIAQAGGGTLITQGSHFLDVAVWALNEQPLSATGYTTTPLFNVEVEALAHGIIETQGGTLISVVSSMVAATEQKVTIEAYGEKGTALYQDLPWPSVKFVGAKIQKEHPPERGVHALQRSLSGFANWILKDKPFLTPAASTLPVLTAVDGIYQSAVTGLRFKVES
ncbi:MAG: Gfo/Idh/MocA family oxidoreductase [Chloroflexi bacterium]|nr:Gfo/Idh/MocA family oxidoreductase [Chloroflexota bacterium]